MTHTRLSFVSVAAILLILHLTEGQISCSNAGSYFAGLLNPSSLYGSLRSKATLDNCGHSESCCTPEAISKLEELTLRQNAEAIRTLIDGNSDMLGCFKGDFENTLSSFLQNEKENIENIAKIYLQSYFRESILTAFVDLVDSVEAYALAEGPLCKVDELVTDLTIHYVWELILTNSDNGPTLEDLTTEEVNCTRNFVLETFHNNIQLAQRPLLKSLTRVYHTIRYRNLLSKAVSTLTHEPWLKPCKAELVKLSYCDGCTNLYSSARSKCAVECTRAVSACLEPYRRLRNITQHWIIDADELKYEIRNFNPDYMLTEVPFNVLELALERDSLEELQEMCASNRGRRSLNPVREPGVGRVTRQTGPSLLNSVLGEIDCVTSLAQAVLPSNIENKLCENATSLVDCPDSLQSSNNLENRISSSLRRVLDELNEAKDYILALLFKCHDQDCPDLENYQCPSDEVFTASPTPTVTSSTMPIPSPTPCGSGRVDDQVVANQDCVNNVEKTILTGVTQTPTVDNRQPTTKVNDRGALASDTRRIIPTIFSLIFFSFIALIIIN